MSGTALLDHFSALDDPRQAWKVVYPLSEVLLVVLCGTMAGAEDFAEIERWARRKLDFLRRLSPFARGMPSHDTLTDVMNALPAPLFADCFTAWVETLRAAEPDIVAIDGKTSRRARRGDGPALHLVSAWANQQRLVLGQEAVGGKGNEITAIPLLLARLELTGALVTIRRHRLSARDRAGDPRQGRRLPAGAQGQLADPGRRRAALLRPRTRDSLRAPPDDRRRSRSHRGPPPFRQVEVARPGWLSRTRLM